MSRVCRLLPPRKVSGALSTNSTLAPPRRAMIAAPSAAFPPPITRTSKGRLRSVLGGDYALMPRRLECFGLAVQCFVAAQAVWFYAGVCRMRFGVEATVRKCQSLAAAVVVAAMLTSLSPSFGAKVARAEQDSDGLGACAPGVQLLGF